MDLKRVSAWLFPPPTGDEDLLRLTRLLLWVQAALFATLILGAGLSILNHEPDSYPILLVAAGAVALTMILSRSGHPRQASFIFLLTMLVVQTNLLLKGQGIHDITMMAYAVVLMVASLILGNKAFATIVAASMLSLGFVIHGEVSGLWTSPLSIYTDWTDFAYLSLIILLAAFIARLLSSNLFTSLQRARDNEQKLANLNRQLEEQAAQIRLAEKRWYSLLVQVPGWILELDLDGNILFANTIDEAQRKRVFGSPLSAFMPDMHQEDLSAAIAQSLATGETINFEAPARTADGTVRWFASRLAVIRDESNPRVVLVVTDIDERKKAEEEISRLNTELEQRVRTRTAEYEAANRELESFAYSVSHDLRAPLRAINGFSQILTDEYGGALDETGRDHLARIRAATLRMGGLIDDLLNLSRVTRSELNRARVNLSEVALEVADNLHRTYPERAVEVHIHPDMSADVDASLVRIILENLLNNAWKFTAHNAQTRIEFGRMVEESEFVYFISDNGAGFNMAYADKLFGPFQRLHAPGEFEGTGIGLATVQRIVQRHGGRIWARGQEGAGATFFFTLE
ncbi:MAG: PAS domain-containing protein [Anaerolineaceae bacterium]|nr:PAS domain-containing protein [Anaerolineaceae bacterium]